MQEWKNEENQEPEIVLVLKERWKYRNSGVEEKVQMTEHLFVCTRSNPQYHVIPWT